MPSLFDLAAALEGYLGPPGADEPPTVYLPSDRPTARLGLALEPWPGLAAWVAESALDAVFLHRPWGAEAHDLPPGVGVLASHRPFDARVTVCYNPELAEALGLAEIEPLGEKDGRPLGMVGVLVEEKTFDKFIHRIEFIFGGVEDLVEGGASDTRRVAVVGAMTKALAGEAAARGAEVYLTGQLRHPALSAVRAAGLSVVAVGHARGEEHGLRQISSRLHDRWPTLQTLVPCRP